MLLAMAKEWGMPPWRIWDEAPALWVDRWMAVEDAKAEPETRGEGIGQTQQGNVRKTRVI